MGFRRSRALWDHARRSYAHSDADWSSKLGGYTRAILYELQPVRFPANPTTLIEACKCTAQSVFQTCWSLVTVIIPRILGLLLRLVSNLTIRQWLWVAAAVAYYYLLRWIHETLHAGPFMLMTTALVAIFTIGLGDTADGEFSAYSVFNRGFEKLLGSVDADQLLAQHVGGGGMAAGMMMMRGQQNQQHDEAPPAAAPHRQQQAARAAADADGDGENRNNNPNDENDNDAPRGNNNNRSRKSGKKARRRNQEQRQEMRRQREAAAAMGFAGNERDQVAAMNRLIEDQVAVNHHQDDEDQE